MADEDQSIDDQAETATGGLTNDMPGLPVSPPGGRGRPPSALGGLASAFQRVMGGAPPPQAAQAGPSPWQTPGQSQIRQGGQRWMGNTASLVLPRGSPQPQARFTPYIRPQPTTDYTQWGQEDQSGQLPSSFEGPGLYKNMSNFFGQNGSSAIIPLALSMGKNAGAFVNGVMQGQEYAAKMHRQKMADDAFELEQKQQKEMTDYFDTVNEYATVAGTTSGEAAKNYAINGKTLLDALGEQAMKLGDDKFAAVVATGSVDKALAFLHERNTNWQTLSATNKSTQKQEDEDTKKELGIPDDQSSGGGGRSPSDVYQRPRASPAAAQPGRPPQGGPAPAAAGPNAPTDPNEPLKPYQEIANGIMKGEGSLNAQPKVARPAMSGWMAQQQQKLDQIQADKAAGRITEDQVPAALEKILPGAGADYQSIYQGNNPPPGAAARSPYWQSIRSLAEPDPITQQATKRDFASGGRSGTRLTAGSRMSDAAITVLKEMKKFKEGELPPQNIVDRWIATGITGDPKWSNLFTAVNAYMQEAQSLQSPTGRFFETEMEEQRKNVKLTAGLPAIRGILKIDAENSSKLVDQLKGNYQRGTRDFKNDPTTYDPQKVDVLKALTNLDEQRGFEGIPQDRLPEELRGLGLGGTGQEGGASGSKIPSGWTVTPVQ